MQYRPMQPGLQQVSSTPARCLSLANDLRTTALRLIESSSLTLRGTTPANAALKTFQNMHQALSCLQVTQHQQAVRPPLQQAAAYPGAYGMMAATRPAAAAPLQPTPAAPQKQAHELVRNCHSSLAARLSGLLTWT